jgi:hypothetical protein
MSSFISTKEHNRMIAELEAEVERLRDTIAAHKWLEFDQMRQDAARYRWLREGHRTRLPDNHPRGEEFVMPIGRKVLDAAIDAARGGE